MKQRPERHRSIPFGLAVTALAVACATEGPPSNLPPSASDLLLLKSAALCDQKTVFLQRHSPVPIQREPWGSGQELRIPAEHSASKAEESYFFDEDGVLVGALFTYRSEEHTSELQS